MKYRITWNIGRTVKDFKHTDSFLLAMYYWFTYTPKDYWISKSISKGQS